MKNLACDRFSFRGHQNFPATASGAGNVWVKTDTSSSGSPTVGGANGGGVAMTLDSTTEVQNLCLSFGDVLSYDIDDLVRAEFIVKCTASLDTATSIAFGMASARNDAIDSIAAHASIRVIGSNDVVVESDDGTNDNDDVATGITLGSTFKRFAIDFATGIATREAPSVSLGGKANVQFFGGNSVGSLRRLASGTRFDMSNYSSGLQPYFQIQKTSDSNTDSLTLLECVIYYKQPSA